MPYYVRSRSIHNHRLHSLNLKLSIMSFSAVPPVSWSFLITSSLRRWSRPRPRRLGFGIYALLQFYFSHFTKCLALIYNFWVAPHVLPSQKNCVYQAFLVKDAYIMLIKDLPHNTRQVHVDMPL